MPDVPSLLPPNATALELALEQSLAHSLSANLQDLWNPETIPAALLPWLAWALSVDVWDTSWGEARKRNVLAASIDTHRVKGTIGALKGALAALDRSIEVTEWFTNGGAPYTFHVAINVSGTPIDQAELSNVFASISSAKNARSKLNALILEVTNEHTMFNAVAPALALTVQFGAQRAAMRADFTGGLSWVDDNPARVTDMINLVRPSTKSWINHDRTIVSAGPNQPLLSDAGILVWDAVENMALWSEDFTQSPWAGANITLTPGAADGPRGPGTMTKQASTAAGGTVFLQSTVASTNTHTFSVVVKKGSGATEFNRFGIWNVSDGPQGSWAALSTLDYDTGVLSVQYGTGRAIDLGNETYRVEVMSLPVNLGDILIFYPGMTGIQTNGVEYCFIDTAQFEAGLRAGPYTKTAGTPGFSGADEIVLAQDGVLPFAGFNPNAVTLLLEWSDVDEITGASAPYLFEISDGSLNNRWFLQITDLSFWLRLKSQIAGVVTDGPTFTSAPGALSNGTHKVAISYDGALGRMAMSVDGGAVSAVNLSLPAGLTQFRLGSSMVGQTYLNGHIAALIGFDAPVLDAELPALSTVTGGGL